MANKIVGLQDLLDEDTVEVVSIPSLSPLFSSGHIITNEDIDTIIESGEQEITVEKINDAESS